jgi:uncharacterized membrane protein YeaQ/YmgE (transglycosylase-associated protein family)
VSAPLLTWAWRSLRQRPPENPTVKHSPQFPLILLDTRDGVQGVDPRERNMSAESLLVILLVGLIAGWLAGQIIRGTGFGLIADMCIGIVGALIGSWLLPRLGVHLGSGVVAAIIGATIGSILLLLVLRLVNRRGRW